MVIYDSVQQKKVKFEPLEEKKVKIYVCGPTVYDDAHLGHARSSIAFDLLRRVLEANGYQVTFVKNFTDIDDKIIKKMQESGKSLEEITDFYINSYKEDMHSINVLDASIEPKATKTLEEMIKMIENLLKKGFAYKLEDGIYFDTSRDKKYLSISHRNNEEENRSRVLENISKRNPKDFVLWKYPKEGEPKFTAPFGEGRPGWHIECSAMIKKHLSYKDKPYQIDIHCGGADLLFPHHENEATQSRCSENIELAKYWLHNGFVNIDGEKMSKSLGNSFFIKDALKVYSGEVLRFYLISTHYRANFNFNEEDLHSSKKRLDKLYRLKKRIYPTKASTPNREFKKQLLEALNDDLNISKTLSFIDEMITKANEELDKNPKNKSLKREIIANIEFISQIIGVGGENPYHYFQSGVSPEEREIIEKLIRERNEYKKAKEYKKADEVREKLLKMDILIMDTNEGTFWEKR